VEGARLRRGCSAKEKKAKKAVAKAKAAVKTKAAAVKSKAPSSRRPLSSRSRRVPKRKGGAHVIAFATRRAASPRRTTTSTFAVAFAETGHAVLCVDMDRGQPDDEQGIDPTRSRRASLTCSSTGCRYREVVHEREIDVAVASIDTGRRRDRDERPDRPRARSPEGDQRGCRDYDFVCIDTPPSLGLLTVNALTAADRVIVPVQCEYLSMRGLSSCRTRWG